MTNKEQSTNFAERVAQVVSEKNISFFEAVMVLIEQDNIDEHTAAKLIKKNAALFSNIESECEDLNLIESRVANTLAI